MKMTAEMDKKVNDVAAEFQRVSHKQMTETSKRTLRENQSITAQMQKVSATTIELLEENQKLIAENKVLKQQNALHASAETEWATRNNESKKLIHELRSDLRINAEKQQKQEQELLQIKANPPPPIAEATPSLNTAEPLSSVMEEGESTV